MSYGQSRDCDNTDGPCACGAWHKEKEQMAEQIKELTGKELFDSINTEQYCTWDSLSTGRRGDYIAAAKKLRKVVKTPGQTAYEAFSGPHSLFVWSNNSRKESWEAAAAAVIAAHEAAK